MTLLKKILILLLFPLMAFTAIHKFYISVTQVAYSEEDQALQITSRIFIDDLDRLLKERYGLDARLATQQELDTANAFIEKYLHSKFLVKINGNETPFHYLGKRYDKDIAVCYFEITDLPLDSIHSIEIQNDLLTDLFEEQKNIVHILIQDEKKSFVLVRENDKAMLNL